MLCSTWAWTRPSSKQTAKLLDQPDRPIGRPEQERAGVRGDLAPVERGHHLAALDGFISEQPAQVGHDEADPRVELPLVPLDLT
jgi:hypothetical protein